MLKAFANTIGILNAAGGLGVGGGGKGWCKPSSSPNGNLGRSPGHLHKCQIRNAKLAPYFKSLNKKTVIAMSRFSFCMYILSRSFLISDMLKLWRQQEWPEHNAQESFVICESCNFKKKSQTWKTLQFTQNFRSHGHKSNT